MVSRHGEDAEAEVSVRISAYETTDQRIHKDRAIAHKHQAWLDLVSLLEDAIKGADYADHSGLAHELAVELLNKRKTMQRLLRTAGHAP